MAAAGTAAAAAAVAGTVAAGATSTTPAERIGVIIPPVTKLRMIMPATAPTEMAATRRKVMSATGGVGIGTVSANGGAGGCVVVVCASAMVGSRSTTKAIVNPRMSTPC